jgi:hypothetical protein
MVQFEIPLGREECLAWLIQQSPKKRADALDLIEHAKETQDALTALRLEHEELGLINRKQLDEIKLELASVLDYDTAELLEELFPNDDNIWDEVEAFEEKIGRRIHAPTLPPISSEDS